MGCAADFCGKTTGPHSKELVKDLVEFLIKNYDHKLVDESEIIIQANGCPNHCCASSLSEIGISGTVVKKEGKNTQVFNLVLGGGVGPKPLLGRTIERGIPNDQLKQKITNLIDNYLKNRKDPKIENFRDFCNRHSEEELKNFLKE